MAIWNVFWELIKLLPAFWDGVFRFFRTTELPDSLSFITDIMLAMPGWLRVVLIVAAYLVFCFFAFKLLDKVTDGISDHLSKYGSHITDNFALYVVALALCGVDAFVGNTMSFSGTPPFFASLFGYLSVVVLLIAAIRNLIRFKLRGLYFVPLQLMMLAYLYMYFLILLPSFVVFLGGVVFGSLGNTKIKCPSCGCVYNTQKIDHCPRCGKA